MHRLLELDRCPTDPLSTPKFQYALAMLSEAKSYAVRTESVPWDFAVEIQYLRAIGICDNDLRFLIRLNFIEHGKEKSPTLRRTRREFQSSGDLSFSDRSCFVLTQAGIDAISASTLVQNGKILMGRFTESSSPHIERRINPLVPVWDAIRRRLIFNGETVKQFRRRAGNQELVLATFQEEAWPSRIDDPLAPHPCQDMKRRLSDTIKCLNRGQTHFLLHFRGDGTGEGVLWEAAT